MKQIVLKTSQKDVQEFYVETLGGKIIKNYVLQEKDAVKKYFIPMQLEVYEIKLQTIKLELIICEEAEEESLQHVYFELENSPEIFSKAAENSFKTYLRRRNNTNYYYIKDRNSNLIEFKNKKKHTDRQLTEV